MMNRELNSAFAPDINAMIDLKVALGYSENTYMSRAKDFDRFCVWKYPDADVLTESLIVKWLKLRPYEDMRKIHAKAAFVRGLSTYQRAVGKDSYMLPDKYTAGYSMFVPYLFSDEELERLFRAIDNSEKNRNPFRQIMLSTYFRLTYTCGLRPQEGRLLKRNEVDLNTGEVRILNTKRHRNRIIIMSDDMTSLARHYSEMRDAAYPDHPFFFPGPKGGSYTAEWMNRMFKKFFAESNPDIPKDLLPSVRVYDLRHRFATAVLNRWLDQKRDLNSRLPYLRTYLGHQELSSTAYYIHLLPENLVKSAGIDWESMNSLLPVSELWER